MLMETGGVKEVETGPGVSLVDVLIQVLIYYLSKQTKTLKNLLNVYLKLELLMFLLFRMWHWKICSVLTAQTNQRLRL